VQPAPRAAARPFDLKQFAFPVAKHRFERSYAVGEIVLARTDGGQFG